VSPPLIALFPDTVSERAQRHVQVRSARGLKIKHTNIIIAGKYAVRLRSTNRHVVYAHSAAGDGTAVCPLATTYPTSAAKMTPPPSLRAGRKYNLFRHGSNNEPSSGGCQKKLIGNLLVS
jgi:hypothetical protein